MRNYKSISNYFEYYKMGTIPFYKDVETGYIYSLDYYTRECCSVNHEDELKGIETYFIRLPNCIELYWNEPSFYV